jgi:hypothetical protein
MIPLTGNDGAILKEFQPLLEKQVTASTALLDPKERGHRYKSLEWFWTAHMVFEGSEEDLGSDCKLSFPLSFPHSQRPPVYRVHYLRTKNQLQRWREEQQILLHEMKWSLNFALHKASQWNGWGKVYSNQRSGHAAYAEGQRKIWMSQHDRWEKVYIEALKGTSLQLPTVTRPE